MSEKSLLLSLFFLFALSAAYLFAVNERGLDPDRDKDWWSLAFVQPGEEQSLAFIITNHTPDQDFAYTITNGQTVLATGMLSIEPGQSLEHEPSLTSPLPTDRITITVTHTGRDETIYRSL